MRIVLVHPAGSNWVPGRKDVSATANRMAPLGLLSMAAFLEDRGHRVWVHDCLGPYAIQGVENNARAILERTPDLVGFSATTAGFLDGRDIAAAVKKRQPMVKTVFGGVHVSAVGGRLLDRFGEIDFLCMGEGERTLAELAEGVAPAEIDGLVWRDGGQARRNPPRAVIPDLDSLPFPAYHKLP